MLVLILSDIHANLIALDAVLEDAPAFDAVWCLGDLVGYGPYPNECVERIRSFPDYLCLIGNHDQAVLGAIPISRFNPDAGDVVTWTRSVLDEENLAFLQTLPSKISFNDFTLAHGSPNQPVWEYILDPITADRNFDNLQTNYALVGHSHIPLIFHRLSEDAFAMPLGVHWRKRMQLVPRMILNPGSVGQPRDGDPRASYAILDLDEGRWEMRRAAYDIETVQRAILRAGLPDRQALRLAVGI